MQRTQINKKEKNIRFQIVFRPEPEGGFTVLVPSLPGCITFGKDLEHARKMAVEAITLYLQDMIAEGERLPKSDTSYIGDIEIALPAKAQSLTHA